MRSTSKVPVPRWPKDLRRPAAGYVRVGTSMQAEAGLRRQPAPGSVVAWPASACPEYLPGRFGACPRASGNDMGLLS